VQHAKSGDKQVFGRLRHFVRSPPQGDCAVCPNGTRSTRGLSYGTAVVAVSATEKRFAFVFKGAVTVLRLAEQNSQGLVFVALLSAEILNLPRF
jgi:hypothetical protein